LAGLSSLQSLLLPVLDSPFTCTARSTEPRSICLLLKELNWHRVLSLENLC
jgi:hypothetical protein